MESFQSVTGVAAPFMRANVDTDQIIPTRFLARPSEEGVGEGLFAEWATCSDGNPDPEFMLNQAPWSHASILLAGPMFGSGSSREAAPRALRERGFRALIAPSFGDIFFSNCFRNGIVPVCLAAETVQALAERMQAERGDAARCVLTISLEAGTVTVPTTGEVHAFSVPPLLRRMLLEGLDEIALTRTHQAAIERYRMADQQRRPWAYL